MNPIEISELCKKINRTNSYEFIEKQLDDLSVKNLHLLAKELLKNPYAYQYALSFILCRLFTNSQIFANFLSEFLDKVNIESDSCKPLKDKIIINKELAFSLVELMLSIKNTNGVASGIVLANIVEDIEESKNSMIKGFYSKSIPLQRCSIVAIQSLICNYEPEKKHEYLEILKEFAPIIANENLYNLINALQCACEIDSETFEPILESEITKRGVVAAELYIRCVESREHVSISLFQKAIDILELSNPQSSAVYSGLGRIYENEPDYVIRKLESWLTHGKFLELIDSHLIYRIQNCGIEPMLNMLEQQLDKGNPTMRYQGDFILEHLFPSLGDWILWCEKWIDDPKKEKVVLDSLRDILSKLINYEPNGIRERAISLVKSQAIKKELNYESISKTIDISSDSHEGKEHKENTLKALSVLEDIISPTIAIDIDILSANLKMAPFLSRAIDAKWLIEKASSSNPHPLTYIFHQKLPPEGEIEGLKEKLKNEKNDDEQFSLELKINDLQRSFQHQQYWENVFRILEQNNILIKKAKLHDVQNANNILAEAEVFSRLASCFKISVEPDIPELAPKKLEALIEFNGEKALIEVATVYEKLELNLAGGGISIPGGKVKSTLQRKFNTQLKKGKSDPKIPILLILNLKDFLDNIEASNGIYGTFQVGLGIHNESHKKVEETSTRANNGFYGIERSNIVTAIGVYKTNIDRKDSLEGRFYRPFISPINKLSQNFWLLLRTALFGQSENSNWKSLMHIIGIDENTARLLYCSGIEDIGVLANIQEEDFVIDGIPLEKLSYFKEEARRVLNALSTMSVRFLKDVNGNFLEILYNNELYLLEDLLKQEVPPKGIIEDIWCLFMEDAKRILNK